MFIGIVADAVCDATKASFIVAAGNKIILQVFYLK